MQVNLLILNQRSPTFEFPCFELDSLPLGMMTQEKSWWVYCFACFLTSNTYRHLLCLSTTRPQVQISSSDFQVMLLYSILLSSHPPRGANAFGVGLCGWKGSNLCGTLGIQSCLSSPPPWWSLQSPLALSFREKQHHLPPSVNCFSTPPVTSYTLSWFTEWCFNDFVSLCLIKKKLTQGQKY